jgi:hypothetical protein
VRTCASAGLPLLPVVRHLRRTREACAAFVVAERNVLALPANVSFETGAAFPST